MAVKKRIKSVIALFTIVCSIMPLFSAYAFADDNSLGFEITGGIDTEKESIVTFDSSKTVSGKALEGTNINFKVYTLNSAGKYRERYSYEIEVGVSGLFSQNVSFKTGENLLVIEAYNDKDSITEEITVKRKDNEIKDTLKNGVYLP